MCWIFFASSVACSVSKSWGCTKFHFMYRSALLQSSLDLSISSVHSSFLFLVVSWSGLRSPIANLFQIQTICDGIFHFLWVWEKSNTVLTDQLSSSLTSFHGVATLIIESLPSICWLLYTEVWRGGNCAVVSLIFMTKSEFTRLFLDYPFPRIHWIDQASTRDFIFDLLDLKTTVGDLEMSGLFSKCLF